MIEKLDWADAPQLPADDLFARLAGVEPEVLVRFLVGGQLADLPFYRHWKLLRLQSTFRRPRSMLDMPDVFALWRDGRPARLLDGASAPVHDANDDEGLDLRPEHMLDYIRFFFFAIRADDAPFVLIEAAPRRLPTALKEIATHARPIEPVGVDDEGRHLFDVTVLFRDTLFSARVAVQADGQVTMIDDDPLIAAVPAGVVEMPPALGVPDRLRRTLEGVSALVRTSAVTAGTPPPAAGSRGRTGAGRRARRTPSGRPTIVELVELLLERALRQQTQNRLLGYFNATQPAATGLQRLATVVASSSPVVIVESTIPFVEDAVGEIVNGLQPQGEALPISRSTVTSDASGQEALDHGSLPSSGPGLVLIPFLVYPRIVHAERLAFDLAARDITALIGCERVGDLPESLRRHIDVVLPLGTLDEALFAALFERVMGAPPPAGWRTGGTGWVKHLLHTDFEHPRRMQLAPKDAFAFVRAQVTDRLDAVDPGPGGLHLKQLHGLGEARQFAEDLIADLAAAIGGRLPWAQVDRGALLVGPPGTGKTTLARAIAKDCGVRFIQASASSWMAEGGSLGPHIQAIRRTFGEARRYAPSILFIDEIDSLGSRERLGGDQNSIYQTEVINAVLEQMQGLDPAAPVIVIGATNHEDNVDPALRRSGRLDRVIRIPRPNSRSLERIYRHYLDELGGSVVVGPAISTKALGGLSVGLTGADVERIVRGAARRSRKEGRPLTQTDLVAEIMHKPRAASLRLTAAELERTAVHEAGHALALFLSASKGRDIGFVSIVPRDDGVLGFVAPLPDERVHLVRADYDEDLEVALAGRAAEEVVYGADRISSGAGQDLKDATVLVTRMVTKLGLGHGGGLLWSESMSPHDRELAEGVLAAAYARAVEKLTKDRARLGRLAKELITRQELSGDEARVILAASS